MVVNFICADLRWKELYEILSKLQGKELSAEEIDVLTYEERCKMLNSNPVVVAKHFQYCLERLFTDVILGDRKPIGEVQYYAIRIEFQFHGSPHAHCFIWITSTVKLTEDTVNEYVEMINGYISACLPEEQDDELYSLVRTYQMHRHSKTVDSTRI